MPPAERLLALIGFLCLFADPLRAAAACFDGLGDLPGGGLYSRAADVSADGTVVVGESRSSQGMEAFRWAAETGMVGLGDLPGGTPLTGLLDDTIYSTAGAVSADGSVVVGTGLSSTGIVRFWGEVPRSEAFRWTEETGMVGLAPPGDRCTGASDVSSDGSVVVGNPAPHLFPLLYCFLGGFGWTEASGMAPLPVVGRSVSGDGSVVLGTAERNGGPGFVLWSLAGGVQPIPLSDSAALSRDGRVVAGSVQTTWPRYFEAAIWSEETGVVVIGGGLTGESHALAVSADGSVVGGTEAGEAFLWRPGDRAGSLREILVDEYDLDLSGWQLSEVRALSDDGLTMVGDGIDPSGVTEAWIAHLGDRSCGPPSELGFRDGCGQRITEDTVLDHPMDCPPGDGLVIGRDFVSVDLGDHGIFGTSGVDGEANSIGTGVRIEGHHGVTIQNGRIIGFETGVRFSHGASANAVRGVQFSGQFSGQAISLEDANDNEISRIVTPIPFEGRALFLLRSHRNRLVENDVRGEGEFGSGIVLEDSRGNQILRNSVHAEPAIMLLRSHGNTVEANQTDGIFGDGIVLYSSRRNRITHNRTAADGAALALFDSDHNWIFGNRICSLVHTSLALEGSDHNRVVQNDIEGVDWEGSIGVAGSRHLVLRRNRVSGGEDGIRVDASSRFVRILENQVFHNRDDGIDVETSSAFVRGNIAFDNGDLGIEAVPGVKDLGRNSAEGNGNPAQCLNVDCQ